MKVWLTYLFSLDVICDGTWRCVLPSGRSTTEELNPSERRLENVEQHLVRTLPNERRAAIPKFADAARRRQDRDVTWLPKQLHFLGPIHHELFRQSLGRARRTRIGSSRVIKLMLRNSSELRANSELLHWSNLNGLKNILQFKKFKIKLVIVIRLIYFILFFRISFKYVYFITVNYLIYLVCFIANKKKKKKNIFYALDFINNNYY